MYKAHKKCLPVNLQTNFNMILGLAYDTQQSKNIRQVFARTTQKANCISVYGVKLWNALQENIKTLQNIHIFKKLYKNEIFKKYSLLLL